MKRVRSNSTHTADITFDDLYDDISRDWQHKAQLLQARRWRHLKRMLKADYKYQS